MRIGTLGAGMAQGRPGMPLDIGALRALTPGCAERIHLNNAGAALLAQPTLDAMTAHLRREAEIGGYEAAASAREAIDAAHNGIAELVGGAQRGDRVVRQRHSRLERGVLLRPAAPG
jgi:selenocysteine lyase/cysteine desulfurase